MPRARLHPVDQLGRVLDQIAQLRKRSIILKGQVGRMGVGFHRAKVYEATVAVVLDCRGGVHVTVKRKGTTR